MFTHLHGFVYQTSTNKNVIYKSDLTDLCLVCWQYGNTAAVESQLLTRADLALLRPQRGVYMSFLGEEIQTLNCNFCNINEGIIQTQKY